MNTRSVLSKLLRGLLIYLGACLLFFGAWVVWFFVGLRVPDFSLLGVPTYGQGAVAGAAVALVFGLIKRPRFGLRVNYATALTFALVAAWLTFTQVGELEQPQAALLVLALTAWGPLFGGIVGSLAAWIIGLVVSRFDKKPSPAK